MDLVDEENVPLFEIGEKRGKIARLGDHRSRGRPEIDPELARHDLRQRRLAEARWPCEQHMIQRLAPRPRRINEDLEVRAHFGLTDELGKRLRPERGFRLVVVAFHGGQDPLGHCDSSFKPSRMSSAAPASLPAMRMAALTAAAASPWP